MKYLITLLIAALSLNAFSQGIPQLPYNPDENGDGLIGVPDLQALLAQYGLEFNSAVLSEDAQSAIVYMGEMAHPVCNLACDNLPGFWHMSTMDDLALVWDELIYPSPDIWVGNAKENTYSTAGAIYVYSYYNGDSHYNSKYPSVIRGCYCAAHELPKVEYSYCNEDDTGFDDCITSKVQDGWFPLGGISSSVNPYSTHIMTQAFWRWAVE